MIHEGHQPKWIKAWLAGRYEICRMPSQPLVPVIGKPQHDGKPMSRHWIVASIL
jgi:hypothetical protein